jgi:hypothetical protein
MTLTLSDGVVLKLTQSFFQLAIGSQLTQNDSNFCKKLCKFQPRLLKLSKRVELPDNGCGTIEVNSANTNTGYFKLIMISILKNKHKKLCEYQP